MKRTRLLELAGVYYVTEDNTRQMQGIVDTSAEGLIHAAVTLAQDAGVDGKPQNVASILQSMKVHLNQKLDEAIYKYEH